MNNDPSAGWTDVQLEASVDFTERGAEVRGGFSTPNPEVLAGGPLEVEFFVENKGPTAICIAVTGDRARIRPSNFTFEADLAGSQLIREDPAANVPDLGGPAGVTWIAAGSPFRQRLLVNEYVRLEKVLSALGPGEKSLMELRCQRPLRVAFDDQKAFETGPGTPMLDVKLTVHVRRADRELESLVASLADEVRSAGKRDLSAQGEWAMRQLAALRSSVVEPYLRELQEHPSPTVRMYVKRGLIH